MAPLGRRPVRPIRAGHVNGAGAGAKNGYLRVLNTASDRTQSAGDPGSLWAPSGPLSLVTRGFCWYPGVTRDQPESPQNRLKFLYFRCGRGRNRTFNKRIKSPLLCQLSYAPGYSVFSLPPTFVPSGAPEVSRTPNPRLRRPMLYPVELRAQKETRNDAQALRGCQGRFPAPALVIQDRDYA